MIHPEWWTRSLADAQEQVANGGESAFGDVVDSLVADLLTSREFLSFLVAETTARMADGDPLDEAVYAVTEEVAAQMQGEQPQGDSGGLSTPRPAAQAAALRRLSAQR